jgi:hypothetical protein
VRKNRSPNQEANRKEEEYQSILALMGANPKLMNKAIAALL